jgi:DNA-binding NarL/FixJ family response regulator
LLILTLTSDGPTVRAAFSAGADGYLLKSGTLQQFQDAIREAMEGLIYLAPELRRAAIVAGGSTPAPEKSDPLKDLSPREIEVFDLLVREYRIKEIAEKLDLNPKTIDTYWTSIRRKLGVDSIAALVKFAIKHRLIDPEDPAPKKPR